MDFVIFVTAVVAGFFGWKFVSNFYIGKGYKKLVSHFTGVSTGLLIFVLTIVVLIPNQVNYIIKNPKVLIVSDYTYKLDNQPAVSISVGETDKRYIDISLLRKNIKENYMVDSTSANALKEISITGTIDNQYYYLYNKKDSFAVLKIKYISNENKKLTFSLEAKLLSEDAKKSLYINKEFDITGDNFDNLFKKE